MSRLYRLALTVRTARHLRPAQLVHRVRLRAQGRLTQRAPQLAARVLTHGMPRSTLGWPAAFVPIDARLAGEWPSPELLARGRIQLLGEEKELDWQAADLPRLWSFHLHYWDWAWALALDPDRRRGRAVFHRVLLQWREATRFGRKDEWSPYVVALRAWAWCGQYEPLVRGSTAEADFADLLSLHAGFLRTHLELDVGGNHLIKNLKALVGLGVFFGDARLIDAALRRLRREVLVQVLPDGGHMERAPAYHCQVLGDLVDLDGLLGQRSPGWLVEAVERMRAWLGVVLLPDGSVPLLNDGFPVPAAFVAALEPGAPAPEGLTHLADTGLVVLRRGKVHVLADVGLPCPNELPAHAHADTLGFWAYAGAQRRVSEVGTSTYAAGPVRDAERSTAGHSTVEVDRGNSTEVWGAFRAARRARPTVHRADDDGATLTLSASHDGYRHLRGHPIHRRTWQVSSGRLVVTDDVTGAGSHEIAVRFHGLQPDAVSVSSAGFVEEPTMVADGWERRTPATVLVHRSHAMLPWRFEVELDMRGPT